MDFKVKRHPNILQRENTALLIIDIQERILKVIHEYERVLENNLKLIKGMKTLNIPIFYTEQYPKGLGPTVEILHAELEGNEAIQKMSFSCAGAGLLFDELRKKNITTVVVTGIESHVCVLQTTLDLMADGFNVHLAYDATSSRRKDDYKIALERMRKNGAEITSTESVLFEILNVCGTDEFKHISKIVK